MRLSSTVVVSGTDESRSGMCKVRFAISRTGICFGGGNGGLQRTHHHHHHHCLTRWGTGDAVRDLLSDSVWQLRFFYFPGFDSPWWFDFFFDSPVVVYYLKVPF